MGGNPIISRERAPQNAEGDFYVGKDLCLACMAPEYEAPELMGFDDQTFCYFKRQPKTREELQHAIEAVCVSCIAALRYAGDDLAILERLRAKGAMEQCDALSADEELKMNSTEEQIIELRKTKVALAILGTCAFVAIGVWLFFL